VREGITVEASAADLTRLEAIVSDRNSPQKHVWLAQIVLLTADGLGRHQQSDRVALAGTVHDGGGDGLLRDKTRPSRIPPLPARVHERTVASTLADPPGEATHWTATMMAKAVGISVSSVQRIWRAHGLQPHRVRQFKLSRDPEFSWRSSGTLWASTSIRRRTRSCSASTRSRDRTQPGLPPGCCGTITHDLQAQRHDHAVRGSRRARRQGHRMQRHRHQEFIRFLNTIEAATPAGMIIHVILAARAVIR